MKTTAHKHNSAMFTCKTCAENYNIVLKSVESDEFFKSVFVRHKHQNAPYPMRDFSKFNPKKDSAIVATIITELFHECDDALNTCKNELESGKTLRFGTREMRL